MSGDQLNAALASWFLRLKGIPGIREISDGIPELDETIGHVIHFSRYMDDWCELGGGCSTRLSIYKTPDLRYERSSFLELSILIPVEIKDYDLFLPTSDEWEVISKSAISSSVNAVTKKITVAFNQKQLILMSKNRQRDLVIYSNHVHVMLK